MSKIIKKKRDDITEYILKLLDDKEKEVSSIQIIQNYTQLKNNILQTEFESEIKFLRSMCHDPASFEENFKKRCSERSSENKDSIPFSEMPQSKTNQLYWDLACKLFNPQNMEEMLAIISPDIKKQLYIASPIENPGKKTRKFLKNIKPRLEELQNLNLLTQLPNINELSHFVMKDGIVLDLRNIKEFPLQLHSNLQEILNKSYPELAKSLYAHNASLEVLVSDLLILDNSGLSPKSAIEKLINGLLLGGERMTGEKYASLSAQKALQEFYEYFNELPSVTKKDLAELYYNKDTTLGSIINNEIKNGICIETIAGTLKAFLQQNKDVTLLDECPIIISTQLKNLTNKYQIISKPTARETITKLINALDKAIDEKNKFSPEFVKQLLDYFNQLPKEVLRELRDLQSEDKEIWDEFLEQLSEHSNEKFILELIKMTHYLQVLLKENEDNVLYDISEKNEILNTYKENFLVGNLPQILTLKALHKITPRNHEDLNMLLLNIPIESYDQFFKEATFKNPSIDLISIVKFIENDFYNIERTQAIIRSIIKNYEHFNLEIPLLFWVTETNNILFVQETIKNIDENLFLEEIKKTNDYGSVLHYVVEYPDLLKILLEQCREKDRFDIVQITNKMGDTILHKIADKADLLKSVLDLLSDEQIFKAVQLTNNTGDTLLQYMDQNDKSFDLLMQRLKSDEKLKLIKNINNEGELILYDAINDIDFLEKILNIGTKNDILEMVKIKGKHGKTILHHSVDKPKSLKSILSLLSEEQRMEALSVCDKQGRTVLHRAANKPESLREILKLLSQEQLFAAIKLALGNGNTVLHYATDNFESLKIILNLFPINQRFNAINTVNNDKESVLFYVAKNPVLSITVLELLPEEQRLVFLQTIINKQSILEKLIEYKDIIVLSQELFSDSFVPELLRIYMFFIEKNNLKNNSHDFFKPTMDMRAVADFLDVLKTAKSFDEIKMEIFKYINDYPDSLLSEGLLKIIEQKDISELKQYWGVSIN